MQDYGAFRYAGGPVCRLNLLHVVQLVIISVPGKQLVVRAPLDNLSLVKHAYFVGILYC